LIAKYGGIYLRPIIGITASIEGSSIQVNRDNSDAVYQSGGLPLVIPYTTDLTVLQQTIGLIDGLLLSGGGDINPMLFGEEPHRRLGSINQERDDLEISLIRLMLDENKPILGICRGSQILNIAAGGNMYQDIYAQLDGEILQHSQQASREHTSHYVHIKPGTKLHELLGHSKIKVNSFHHQAVKDMAPGFHVSGIASDGVIEAFESSQHNFVFGIQWHPENLYRVDKLARCLFHSFIAACRK
jgi:putative glutamine amidotransferase